MSDYVEKKTHKVIVLLRYYITVLSV